MDRLTPYSFFCVWGGGRGCRNVVSRCQVIKPHAVKDGLAGELVTALGQKLQVTAMEMFKLDREAAEEFLEVYKTVVPEYNAMLGHMESGPCLVLELSGEDAVKTLREVAGPADPVIAKHIRPGSLRAKYGHTKVLNALHVTDLPEDGILESEFFFSILQKKHAV